MRHRKDVIEMINDFKSIFTHSTASFMSAIKILFILTLFTGIGLSDEYFEETFNYTGDVMILNIPNTNVEYTIEIWGAEGGQDYNGSSTQGKGGYAIGTYLITDNILYIYVGGQGSQGECDSQAPGGFNGGGMGGYDNGSNYCFSGGSGGGSSDVRTSLNDLNSRIIVAGGGAGSGYNNLSGGHGGGLNG